MAGKKIANSALDKKYFVGDAKKPIAIIKRKEISRYVNDDEFLGYYHCWKRLSAGMGLPFAGGWADYPELFSIVMELFTRELEGVRNAR